MEIKDLELTDQDFQLLVDGLDALPDKNASGEMLGMLFEGIIADKDPVKMEKMKADREAKERANKAKKDALKEDIKILQGKLLMFKRWLIQQNALSQVNDILHR